MYKIKAGFDPHTPLRVDMRDAALEDHRKVQEIFFALGYGWRSQKGKPQVVKDPSPQLRYYANYGKQKRVPSTYLFWAGNNQYYQSSMTPQEFYDMVLDTELPLNLTKEHERKRFKTRRGNPVIVVHVETELEVEHPVIGYEFYEGRWTLLAWNLAGKYWRESKSNCDLFEADPLVFQHWNLLKPSIVAIAKDENGNWFGFSEIPNRSKHHWIYDQITIPRFPLCFLNVQFPVCDWEDSLIERPNNDETRTTESSN